MTLSHLSEIGNPATIIRTQKNPIYMRHYLLLFTAPDTGCVHNE